MAEIMAVSYLPGVFPTLEFQLFDRCLVVSRGNNRVSAKHRSRFPAADGHDD